MTALDPAIAEVVLAFADDEHLMGQNHTEWIGVAPFLEEDLAYASIGQDELGHAAMLYATVLDSDEDAEIDRLAFFRQPDAYRSCSFVEWELRNWSDALVRHFMYDTAEELRWKLFVDSSNPRLQAAAERALSEERFHRRHAEALIDNLMRDQEAASRLHSSATKLSALAETMFSSVPGETQAVAVGICAAPFASQLEQWRDATSLRFGDLVWQPDTSRASRNQRHEDFAALHQRINTVFDLDRAAVW